MCLRLSFSIRFKYSSTSSVEMQEFRFPDSSSYHPKEKRLPFQKTLILT